MNAAAPALPASSPGAAAAARTGELPAGRDGAQPAFGFLDQLVQALGMTDGATGGPAPGQAAPPASPAAGPTAPLAIGDAKPAQPSAASSQVTTPPAPPDGPAQPQAAPVPAPAAAETKDGKGTTARPGERRPAAARPGIAADGPARADAQPPILAVAPIVPLPVSNPAAPVQADPAWGSPAGKGAAAGDSAQSAQPGAERLSGRHEPVPIAGAEAPQATVPEAAQAKTFAQHLTAAAEPGPDKPETAPAAQVDALLPSAAPSGASVGTHAEPAHSAAPATPAQPAAAAPAAQMAPALVHIAAAPGGAQHVTVRLDPVELGELRVHIERPREGPVHVTVEATRPETLQLLRQDQPALHRALDQAGLPPEGRIVVLQQASPETGSQRATAGDAGSGSAGGQGNRGGSQGWSGSGGNGGEPGGDAPRRTPWLRAGLDITA